MKKVTRWSGLFYCSGADARRQHCKFHQNPRPSPTMAKGKKYLIFILIIVFGVGLDQYTKHLANIQLGTYCNPEYPGFDYAQQDKCNWDPDALLSWTHIYNDGAFLSMGSTWDPTLRLILLTIVPGLLLLGVLVYFLRSDKVRTLEAVVFALIAAGGLGNIIDRVMAGKVVDFMHMHFGFAGTGIFNVADLYITFGVVIYLLVAGAAYVKSLKEPKTPEGNSI
jgi:signal peptidase II